MNRSACGLGLLVAAVLLAGCVPQTKRASSTGPAAVPSVSWDGTYRGSVQITGLGSGIQKSWCETDPQMVVQVTGNAFSYAMPHPNAPDNPTPVYSATIAPDGAFSSQIGTGLMSGRVIGTRMSGTINGSVCVYSFALERF
jgi:hypothetical protein